MKISASPTPLAAGRDGIPLLFQWLSDLVKGLFGSKVSKEDFPGMRLMARHYRKTYLSKRPKGADYYIRHLRDDPLRAIIYGMLFYINSYIKPISDE